MVVIPEPFIRPNYRGLKDSEDDLLRQYLQRADLDIVGLETHVNLGPGETLPQFTREELREGWRKASQLKADAIVETKSSFVIVELKDFIRTSGLGQALAYRYWFTQERQPNKPVRMVVTAPDINPSAVQPFQQAQVKPVLLSQEGRRHFQAGLEASPPFGP